MPPAGHALSTQYTQRLPDCQPALFSIEPHPAAPRQRRAITIRARRAHVNASAKDPGFARRFYGDRRASTPVSISWCAWGPATTRSTPLRGDGLWPCRALRHGLASNRRSRRDSQQIRTPTDLEHVFVSRLQQFSLLNIPAGDLRPIDLHCTLPQLLIGFRAGCCKPQFDQELAESSRLRCEPPFSWLECPTIDLS